MFISPFTSSKSVPYAIIIYHQIVQQLSSNSIEAINSLNNMKNGVKGGHTYIDAALNEAIKIFDSITSSQGNSQNVLVTVSDG